MEKNFINIKIILRVLILFGILGYNIVYTQKYNYFIISIYILITCGLFFLEGILNNKKYKFYVNVVAIIISIIFMFTELKFSILIIAILIIEKTKRDIWGNMISILIIIIVTGVQASGSGIYFSLYSLVFFLSMYRLIVYLLEKIERLENADSINRKRLVTKIKESKYIEERNKQSIKLVRLEERNELGRRMHDKIGHIIAGSLMRLEASKIILGIDKDKGEKMLDEVIDNLRGGMDDIRDIIHKTTPLKEELGINRIKGILVEKLRGSDIGMDVSFSGDLSVISYGLWNSIESFVVELSTNSLKYSKCTKITFKIEILNKLIKIQFKDDGVGGSNIKKGYGIGKMEEEVIGLNGKLIIDGSSGFNTVILLEKNKEG